MTVNGKEVHFKATIRALREIAKMCPDGDINKADQLFTGATADVLDNTVRFVSLLSGGALSEDDLLDLDVQELTAVQSAAADAFRADQQGEIRVESKKEKATEAENASQTA
jgi:hypothetical protein